MTVAPTGFADALSEHYELRGVIGEGGMATVYEAYDRKHDRSVALKVLHDDLAAELGPERFRREIRIAARLQHPHILTVFDSGEAAGRLWFTMPYITGESLRARIDREERLPVDEALRIAREAAQALEHAHKQGVIHRDIKPENILLTEDGSTLVADFGIARSLHDNMGATGLAPGLTQTGSAVGTPMYMAPEQATGEGGITAQADQYALAAVLYEMLTGATPFTGATAAALMAARFTTGVAPITQRRAEVPAHVDMAVRRALELSPADRFETIGGFTQAIAPPVHTPTQFAAVAVSGANVTPQPASPARGWKPGVVALAVVVASATGLLFMQPRQAAPAASEPIRIAVLPFQILGDTTDAYFAEGMADELRGKLLELPNVQVIARSSSVQYAKSPKSSQEIAKELDVRYLLMGTFRWEKRPDGSSVVHLRPELVQVTGKGPPTTKWQRTFDQPLTDVLAMQIDVAQQVAGQLLVALGSTDRSRLAVASTTDPQAYDAFLRAAAFDEDDRPSVMRQRAADLERAVSLDPGYAIAWGRLATTYSRLFDQVPDPALRAKAERAAAKATSLAPGDVETVLARGNVRRAFAPDTAATYRELEALRLAHPNNIRVIRALALTEISRANHEKAAQLLRTAVRLDPNNPRVWLTLATADRFTRNHAAELEATSRAMALSPTVPDIVTLKLLAYLATGRLSAGRALLDSARRVIAPEVLNTHVAMYGDLAWVLDSAAQTSVLRAPLSAFDGSIEQQLIVQAQVLLYRGDTAQARVVAADAVRAFLRSDATREASLEWQCQTAFAAGLAGRRSQSHQLLQQARDSRALATSPRRVIDYCAELEAKVRVLNGEYELAFDILEQLLGRPSEFSKGVLALDPLWAPLRTSPRYKRLISMEPVAPKL